MLQGSVRQVCFYGWWARPVRIKVGQGRQAYHVLLSSLPNGALRVVFIVRLQWGQRRDVVLDRSFMSLHDERLGISVRVHGLRAVRITLWGEVVYQHALAIDGATSEAQRNEAILSAIGEFRSTIDMVMTRNV